MSFEHMFVVRTYVRMFAFAIFCGKQLGRKIEQYLTRKTLSVKYEYHFGKRIFLEMLFLKTVLPEDARALPVPGMPARNIIFDQCRENTAHRQHAARSVRVTVS